MRFDLTTYEELRARHPQFPDPRWISADDVTIDLSNPPIVIVSLTVIAVDPETQLADVDLSPMGYGTSPVGPLIHDELRDAFDSERARFPLLLMEATP